MMHSNEKKPWVMIVTHSKWRDLAGNALLKHWLNDEYGYPTDLINGIGWKGSYWDILIKDRPDVIVFPKFWDIPRFKQWLVNSNIDGSYRPITVVIPTEHETWGMDDDELARYPRWISSLGDLSSVDLALCWNQRMADVLCRFTNIKDEVIEVTGNPRFDYYANPFGTLAGSRTALLKKYRVPADWGGQIVTVATAFPYADLIGQAETEKYESIHRFYVQRSMNTPSGIFEALVQDNYESRESFVRFCRDLLRAEPDTWLILKPHPEEDAAFYLDALGTHPRLSFVDQEFSFRVLAVSDLHVLHNCTTGREAWLCGLPTINLVPTEESQAFLQLAKPGHLNAFDSDQALHLAHDILHNGDAVSDTLLAERKRILDEDFQIVDGQRARACARTISSTIDRIGRTRTPWARRGWRQRATFGFRRELSAMYRALRSTGRGRRNMRNSAQNGTGRSDPVFSPGEERKWLRHIRAVAEVTADPDAER